MTAKEQGELEELIRLTESRASDGGITAVEREMWRNVKKSFQHRYQAFVRDGR